MVRSFISALFGGDFMLDIIGVVLDSLKNIYYFSPQNLKLKRGQVVLVETENGIQIGQTYKKNQKKI